MQNKKRLTALGSLMLMLSVLSSICLAQTPTLDAALNEQVVMVPVGSGLFGVKLETTIFKPAGDGPFPLLIMNHGKASGNPHFQPRARFLVISREFVKRGYAVVIPMRKGFSQSTGLYVAGGCNIAGNGNAHRLMICGAGICTSAALGR
ncbi:S9 family peptidase [Glaciimonas sp. PCH181]|uniref:alpha/beta hydrolase family protein n=1 Tax=Glaciimonas sp. PCH181 TaxID=2133943 RepID=UPI001CED70F7|nr:CocE/NonD family hydrolase [Glaciimonas sp. PCH181]